MERHVSLLAVLANLWGGLIGLVGISLVLLAGGAAVILWGPDGESVALAAGLTAAFFTALGVFSLFWGVAHVWVAMRLRRHDPVGRVVMLGLAFVNLLVFPFGTALGAYALWILMANEGRRLFVPHPPDHGPVQSVQSL